MSEAFVALPRRRKHGPRVAAPPGAQRLLCLEASRNGILSAIQRSIWALLAGALLAAAPTAARAQDTGRWVIFMLDSGMSTTYSYRYGFRGMGRGAALDLSAEQLANLMGDPFYSEEGRRRAAMELRKLGKDAIPVLIAHLDDKRVYQDAVGTAAPTTKPPATGMPDLNGRITVGAMAEELLYQIITPRYDSPYRKLVSAPKSASMYRVASWRAFWKSNSGRSLKEMHVKVQHTIDAYWKAGGVEQTLDVGSSSPG